MSRAPSASRWPGCAEPGQRRALTEGAALRTLMMRMNHSLASSSAADLSFSEKRRTPRYEVELEITVIRGGQSAPGRTHNVSMGGVLLSVELDSPLAVGDRVSVRVPLPDLAEPLAADAQVRWINAADPGTVGVQFVTGFRARETWALGRFLERVARAP